MIVSTTQELAKIAINKSLLKEYKSNTDERTVYLEDCSEFQIQLFNPFSYTIGAKISINEELGDHIIVIRPGERIWLDRYLDSPKRLKFSTYTVDRRDNEVMKAIKRNGNITIEFFKEKKPIEFRYRPNNILYRANNYHPMVLGGPNSNRYIDLSDGPTCCYSNVLSSSLCAEPAVGRTTELPTAADIAASTININMETGRIERGSKSNQNLVDVDIDFEYYSFKTEKIKILPMSRKPVYSNDLQKIYCTECGRKLLSKYKFCPYCGNKVD